MTPKTNLEAYRILYQIHNHLRDLLIDYNFAALKLDRPGLTDYIYVLHKIKKVIDDDAAADLYKLIPIRNKVCHMHLITESELRFIVECLNTIHSL